jgi:hypothetical protein
VHPLWVGKYWPPYCEVLAWMMPLLLAPTTLPTAILKIQPVGLPLASLRLGITRQASHILALGASLLVKTRLRYLEQRPWATLRGECLWPGPP